MAKIDKDTARALSGQPVDVAPYIQYPRAMAQAGDPLVDKMDFLQKLVRLAARVPELDDADFAPPIIFFDDFFWYDPTATVGKWAVVEDAGATTGDKPIDGVGGWVNIGPDGDEHDEIYVSSANECFKVEAGKRLYFEAKVKPVEADTNEMCWCVGLSDTVAANTITDAGAMAASFDGIVFFKGSGGLTFDFIASNGSNQDTASEVGTETSGTAVRLGFLVEPGLDADGEADSTKARVTPYVDGVAGEAVEVALSGMGEMHVLFGVKKDGTGGNEEALQVDYVMVVQER